MRLESFKVVKNLRIMKWIKASEQTPKEVGIYFAKWKNTNGETGKTLLDWDGDMFQPMYDHKLTEIEWLDEDEM